MGLILGDQRSGDIVAGTARLSWSRGSASCDCRRPRTVCRRAGSAGECLCRTPIGAVAGELSVNGIPQRLFDQLPDLGLRIPAIRNRKGEATCSTRHLNAGSCENPARLGEPLPGSVLPRSGFGPNERGPRAERLLDAFAAISRAATAARPFCFRCPPRRGSFEQKVPPGWTVEQHIPQEET
jgi:hypothetical protein